MNSIEEWLTKPDGLAPRLRNLRKTAGLTGTQLAAHVGLSQSKVSKLETGKQTPDATDIANWVRACGGTEQTVRELQEQLGQAVALRREWRRQVQGGQVGIQHDYDQLARNAAVIRNFETVFIPGLLQTSGYARARAYEVAGLHDGNPAEVDATAARRMQQQPVLYEPGHRFEFVITEAALRLLLCPPEAMLSQLARLETFTAGVPNVLFGIIPFGVVLARSPQHGFVLYDDVALVETFESETTYREVAAKKFDSAMDDLVAEAVTGDEARRLLVRAMEEIRAA